MTGLFPGERIGPVELNHGDVVTFCDHDGPVAQRTVMRSMKRFVEFTDGQRWCLDLRTTWPKPRTGGWVSSRYRHWGRPEKHGDREAIADRNARTRHLCTIGRANHDDWSKLGTGQLKTIAEWLAATRGEKGGE